MQKRRITRDLKIRGKLGMFEMTAFALTPVALRAPSVSAKNTCMTSLHIQVSNQPENFPNRK